MPKTIPALSLNFPDQEQIWQWLTAHGTPQQVALRGRIVLAAAEGQSESAIARQLGTNRKTVRLWRTRFAAQGLESLWEVAPGRGRKPTYGPEKVKGMVDEKSQIQALDRTQPGLPLKKGRCGTMTHDYKRHGTTTLFAALEVLEGRVVGQCFERHRNQEFLRFLRRLDQEFPGEVPLHLVMDNYGTHQHPHVQAWLKRHPRFIPHFVPTSCSWLNLVERWFRELTTQSVRRGSFTSVQALENAIGEFLAAWNENPNPFVWTATVESIQEKLSRCRQTLEQIKPGCTQPRTRKKKLPS